jgi:tetratricopeptide (TPR) repeat protein
MASEADEAAELARFVAAAAATEAELEDDEFDAALDRLLGFPTQFELWAARADPSAAPLRSALLSVGMALLDRQRLDEGRPWIERAAAEELRPDPPGFDHELLGVYLLDLGEHEQARAWYLRALTVAQANDADLNALGFLYHQIGSTYAFVDDYANARPWFERAADARARGNRDGVVLDRAVASSARQVGHCALVAGDYLPAARWYAEAIAAYERDPDGEHDWLGWCLYWRGVTLWRLGDQPERARACFVRAAEQLRQGDAEGRIDWDQIGRCHYYSGRTLVEEGRLDDALIEFDRAAQAELRGDEDGCVDHHAVAVSLHQAGWCLARQRRFVKARSYFERAAGHSARGDLDGRVDHSAVGRSFYEIGGCLVEVEDFEAAQPWFEQAVAAERLGDGDGRVDHASLGTSLYQVGWCLAKRGRYAQAIARFREAAELEAHGDVHGQVDHDSIGDSLHQVGWCLTKLRELASASWWFERAVTAKLQGNLSGAVDHESVAASCENLSRCQQALGAAERASSWSQRAENHRQRAALN